MSMSTRLENGILHNIWQPVSAVKSFIDLGEFEAIKILSGLRALCCDKHQFHAKMAVRTQTVFEISLLNIVVLTR